MFKAILLFIKAHTIATIVTTTVVIGTVVTTPIVVENYKLDKNVKENLDMLVSSDYKAPSDSSETEKNVILNNDNNNEQHSENKSVNTNEPLTFRIEVISNDNGTDYKIVPSYDKDYSQWSMSEKWAYQKTFERVAELAEENYNNAVSNEKQILDNMQKEFELIEASWSEYYPCVTGNISYNSYTRQYKGVYTKKIIATPDEYNSGYTFKYDEEHFSGVSAEEFRTVIYPIMLKTYEEAKKYDMYSTPEDAQYIQNLEIVYHLSD